MTEMKLKLSELHDKLTKINAKTAPTTNPQQTLS